MKSLKTTGIPRQKNQQGHRENIVSRKKMGTGKENLCFTFFSSFFCRGTEGGGSWYVRFSCPSLGFGGFPGSLE